jgi:dimethylargininase
MRCHDFTHALLRRPGRSVANGLSASGGPAPVYEQVLAEHHAYAQALERVGLTVEVLEPLEDFPDSIFVEDPALVFGEGAILLDPGAPSRNGEGVHMLPALERRFPQVRRIEAGHADGGDVMVTPDAVLIGLSTRTDRTGAESLVRALGRIGKVARIVQPPAGALHLKTIASLIDDETVLTTPEGRDSGLFAHFRQIVTDPEEVAAANALRVNGTLLLAANHPRIAERLDAAGYALDLLDTTHIARIDAGLSCMSLRWRAEPVASLPPRA